MNKYGVLLMAGIGRYFLNIARIALVLTLIAPIVFATDTCSCSTGGNSATVDQALTSNQMLPEAHDSDSQQMDNATLPERTHPIMHPSRQEFRKWAGKYEAAPKAYLSPKIRAALAEAPPMNFSLLDYLDYNPSDRDQGYCGDCWAWAGTGVMEIDRAYQTGVKDRLSVQYFNSKFNGGKGSNWACCGGWLEDFASFYDAEKIAIPWSNTNAGWKDGSRICELRSTGVPASSISTDPHYSLSFIRAESIATQGVAKEDAIASIKNVLVQGKAIWFGFFLPTNSAWMDFFGFWDNEPENAVWEPDGSCGKMYNYLAGGGHAVLCVGFNDTDPKNRYWIMLNSWGASPNRPRGLFRVNMDMNYDCSYAGFGNAFYWMTLNISYANAPPKVPSKPYGAPIWLRNRALKFTASSYDPNGDQLNYTFDWGDGTNSTTTLVSSGTKASLSHIWSKPGKYLVKCKATDINDAASGWSDSRPVRIF